jgi:1-acyl-sn-glycerol-3-phosphate acyltransferase
MTGRPALGDALPRRGNGLSRALGAGLLRVFGWRIEGTLPDEPRLLGIGAPHTSNWDFVFSIAAMLALGLRANWIGKHTLFRWPLGGLMRWLGGIPVDRTRSRGFVEQVVGMFNSRDALLLGIAPEGTRKKVDRWKTGFYHIAHGAGVPILPIYWDYGRKVLGFGPPITPTGDLKADLERIYAFYARIHGRHPLEMKADSS